MIDEGEVPKHRKPYIPAGYMAILDNVYKCAGDGSACPGAFMDSPLDVMCAHGGTGVACALCADGSSWNGNHCVKCTGGKAGPVVFFVVLCILLSRLIGSTFAREEYGQYTAK